MPKLLILRHAKSAWNTDAATDLERPLTGRGRRASTRMAKWLRDHELEPDITLSSPAVRCRETLQSIVGSDGRCGPRPEFHDDLYGADVDTWLRRLQELDESTTTALICGHNPGLEDLSLQLSADPLPRADNGKLLTTAAIIELDFDGPWAELSPDSCRLVELVRPRSLPRD